VSTGQKEIQDMNPAGMYNTTAYVLTRTFSTDGLGGQTATNAIGSTFPCRIRQLNALEQQASGTTDQRYTHRMYCAASVSLTEAAQIVSGGVTWEVGTVNAYADFQQVDIWRVNR
jgi:hypothetical protein